MREAEEYVRSHIWALEDAVANSLRELYLQAYNDLARALTLEFLHSAQGETWKATDPGFRARTEALLRQINAEMETLTRQAGAMTLDASIRAWGAGYYGRAWALEMGLRGGAVVMMPLLPAEAIRAAILSPYLGNTFLDRFANARDEFVYLIRRSIVESQIRGEGIYAATMRLRRWLGLTGNIPRSMRARMEMIARTEILRASNQGAMSIYENNRDLLKGWEWLSTKDERTCVTCAALDGQGFPFDFPQLPPPGGSHPMCRCTPIPILLDSELERAIAGPREIYRDWAARRGISIHLDGGVLRFRGAPAPKSPSAGAKQSAPNLYASWKGA